MRAIVQTDWEYVVEVFDSWWQTNCPHYGEMIEAILVDPVIAALGNNSVTMLWHGRIIDEPQGEAK